MIEREAKGVPLFRNEDGTYSYRSTEPPFCDTIADLDGNTAVTINYRFAGTEGSLLSKPLRFPINPGAPELVCETDASLVLVKQNNEKCPMRLVRKTGVAAGAGVW